MFDRCEYTAAAVCCQCLITRLDELFSRGYLKVMKETEILRTWRKREGIKQRDLAQSIGIGTSYMCDLEQGRRDIPPHILARMPPAIRAPLVRARIAELEKLL